jgi:DNA (cytosine-5)-methyltransferase 1
VNELALFAGAGGGLLASKLLGWRTVCAVEIDAYCANVLVARQNEKILEPFPIWDDVSTFNGEPWSGIIDVVSGGFPCQDISAAGAVHGFTKGVEGGGRSGLWRQMARIIGEVRPNFVFVENSPMLASRGLSRVLGDLSQMGYDAKWGTLAASKYGAPHKRERMWIFANASGKRMERQGQGKYSEKIRPWGQISEEDLHNMEPFTAHKSCGESPLLRVDDGMAYWMDRIKAIGNGQVPIVAKNAIEELLKL